MELLIGVVKERLEGTAVRYCLLNRVEVRLEVLSERISLAGCTQRLLALK